MRVWTTVAYFLFLATASAHYGAPFVQRIEFPSQRLETAWFVIENVGLITMDDDGLAWLCDEAITPLVGFNDLALVDSTGDTWLAATRQGLFRTTNGGCEFQALEGVLSEHVTHFLRPRPNRPGEVLVATQTLSADVQNDVFLSEDGGLTWTPAGLQTSGRIRTLHRSEADADFVYVVHSDGAAKSDDGGRTFVPIDLSQTIMESVSGTDFELLGVHPFRPEEIYGAVVRFPESKFLRSRDGGETWDELLAVEDIPETLVFDAEGDRCLLSMPFEGLQVSNDGCETFEPLAVNLVQEWLSCLTRGPDGSVWACDRRAIDALVFRSDDFGLNWSPEFLADFSQDTEAWACGPDSKTARACAVACDRAVADCLEDGEMNASDNDGQMPDREDVDSGRTGGLAGTTGGSYPLPEDGGEMVAAPRKGSGGCSLTPLRSGTTCPLWVCGVLLLLIRFRHYP